ncbi:hypothetical protein [Alysiella filiformis]|uniref:hypothetical protein n=1 Tax=Alysiella filiformis TaxID=194196 RepID=UPI0011777169|nr:hypothetical protein [Alysiella filiformis]QMT30742.1 hypothetical protein H3L97_08320 [Alysiella filiformis]UBQ56278.1 hypothetical protein JF568_00365 [Alysiella filiformis DSM 16848]
MCHDDFFNKYVKFVFRLPETCSLSCGRGLGRGQNWRCVRDFSLSPALSQRRGSETVAHHKRIHNEN